MKTILHVYANYMRMMEDREKLFGVPRHVSTRVDAISFGEIRHKFMLEGSNSYLGVRIHEVFFEEDVSDECRKKLEVLPYLSCTKDDDSTDSMFKKTFKIAMNHQSLFKDIGTQVVTLPDVGFIRTGCIVTSAESPILVRNFLTELDKALHESGEPTFTREAVTKLVSEYFGVEPR